MATHDYVISNDSGANVRADINNALQAILTNNSSGTAPTTTAAGMFWVDTSNASTHYIKQRNHDDTAWVSLFAYDTTAKTISPIVVSGTTTDNGIARFDGTTGKLQDSGVTIDDNGNFVGTGDSNGGAIIIDDAGSIGLEIQSNSPTILLKEDDTVDTNYQIRLDSGKLNFQTQNDARNSASSKMTIDSSGNVGIGTSSPAVSLEVRAPKSDTEQEVLRIGQYDAAGTDQHDLRIFTDPINNSVAYKSTGTNSGSHIFYTGNAERMRILSSGGITFNGDTSTANALDDYEEGTFTPTAYGATTAGTTTYVAQRGIYTKVGNIVHFNIFLNVSNMTGTGNLYFGGLPFTTLNAPNYYHSFSLGFATLLTFTGTDIGVYADPNTAYIKCVNISNGAGATYVQVDTSFQVMIGGSYTV